MSDIRVEAVCDELSAGKELLFESPGEYHNSTPASMSVGSMEPKPLAESS